MKVASLLPNGTKVFLLRRRNLGFYWTPTGHNVDVKEKPSSNLRAVLFTLYGKENLRT